MKLNFFIILFFLSINELTFAQETLVGQINNEKIQDEQNKIITYDVLNLRKPYTFYLPSEKFSISNVKSIQLNYSGNNFKIKYKIPTKIICKSLYSADSLYHYTDVICIVDKITYK